MTVVGIVCGVMVGISGLLYLVRIVRGPSMLDRTVASDAFVATSAGAIGIQAAIGAHFTTLPILVALSLVGFLGSVSVARFVSRDKGGHNP